FSALEWVEPRFFAGIQGLLLAGAAPVRLRIVVLESIPFPATPWGFANHSAGGTRRKAPSVHPDAGIRQGGGPPQRCAPCVIAGTIGSTGWAIRHRRQTALNDIEQRLDRTGLLSCSCAVWHNTGHSWHS